MLKENVPPPPQETAMAVAVVTEEQRARITSNFRAAKALLARKRPLDPIPPLRSPKCSLIDSSNPRSFPVVSAPLSDIHNGLGFRQEFSTPVKPLGVCPFQVKDSIPSSSILDEELDESFLEEVDTICEQLSCVKKDKLNAGCERDDGNKAEESSSFIEDLRCDEMPRKYHDYFQSLNDAQREAACSNISVPLMIVAGPGSGKTSTMVGRVLTLLKEGICPANILAMTFTTAAASEMRDRIGAVVGKAIAKELSISTFHSFCLQLCRSHAEKLGRTTEFLIYGHGQQRRAIIEALRLTNLEEKNVEETEGSEELNSGGIARSLTTTSKKWLKFVIKAKTSGKTPEDFKKTGERTGAIILEKYNDILRSCNALDYHDFINSSVKLLSDFLEVRKECQDTWKAIVVDEFQDTSSMQYFLLKILASHNHITVVGDEDQSIFSFNGADVNGFDSFRRDFPTHKEIKLIKNYRSTRFIVEAASCVINHNIKRGQHKQVETENSNGSLITIKECHNEEAQCSFVLDKILEITSCDSSSKGSFGNIAILYRRQISGRAFQMSFRSKKIPFNVHGVAFYRKKVIKAIMAMLKTTLPGFDDNPFRQAFKALLPGDKEERKMMIDYVDKISTVRKSTFRSVAIDVFGAKISGTFKRAQLTQGRRVLSTLGMLSELVRKEQSISVVISSAANLLPQRRHLEQRAVIDIEDGKYLNEDNDLRSALEYLLDDVYDFLSSHYKIEDRKESSENDDGCVHILKSFLDYISLRESENFRSRKQDNDNSITLTTIHQSKGLEWDIVFIVKAEEQLIPIFYDYKMRPQALSSYVFIAANVILHSRDFSVQMKHLDNLLPPVIPFLTSHHHSLRCFTQLLVYHVLCKLWPAFTDSKSGFKPLEERCFEELKLYLAGNVDCMRLRASMEGFLENFDPVASATPAGIFNFRSEGSEFECVPVSLMDLVMAFLNDVREELRCSFAVDERTIKNESLTVNGASDGILSLNEALLKQTLKEPALDFQKKISLHGNERRPTYDDHCYLANSNMSTFLSELEMEDQLLGSAIQARKEVIEKIRDGQQQIILVASLIDRIPNLAGLARTCEVFRAACLAIADSSIVRDKQFQLISVTAERWIPIIEVPVSSIKAFLEKKRREGFSILGLEQTANSTPLDKFDFPNKTVLVLGREKEGIPVDIIHVLDACVEIPQLGIVRSLNVHVSGAIALWEYTRQQRSRQPQALA